MSTQVEKAAPPGHGRQSRTMNRKTDDESVTLHIVENQSPENPHGAGDGNARVVLPRRSIRRSTTSRKKIFTEGRKARDNYREALHNTRDTITLNSDTAGISPPGGVYQDGPLIGTVVAAKRTAFKVFLVCNNVALFTSLCIVLVLVSIIPFKRKALMRMLEVAHKVIWVAVSFMATAYVAAGVVTVRPSPSPHRPKGLDWTTAFLMSICAGSLGSVFAGLAILFVKHRVMKRKWRKDMDDNILRPLFQRRTRKKMMNEYYSLSSEEEEDDDSSIISDVAISRELGYHSF